MTARELGLSPEQIAASLGRVSLPSERFVERTAGGKRIVTIAAKGENATANSVAFDTIRKEPGTKAVFIVISDAHMAEVPEDTEYTGWYWQADFEYLNDPDIKQIVLYGCTADDIKLRLLMVGIDPGIIEIVDDASKIADAIDIEHVDGAYIAHCVTDVEIAHETADKLIDRIQEVRDAR